MPQKKSGKKHSTKNLGDVTLNDFANSSICKNRPKKSTNNINSVLKTFEEEKSWDEKSDSFDGDFVEHVDEEGNTSYEIRKVEPRRRKKTMSNCEEVSDTVGRDYPIDVWFILSEYIRPEDVGRFAGICRTSYEVTCTAKFWFNLYRRYYSSVPNMPDQLQPECLVRKYGLRTNVIRALHYTYPPFVNKLRSVVAAVGEHPSTLVHRICDSVWQQWYKGGQWVYFFKLRETTDFYVRYHKKGDVKQPDLLEVLDDVSANPDKNHRVLQIVCRDFIPIPPVTVGLYLTSVMVTLASGFRHHRVQLMFASTIYGYWPSNGSAVIAFEPVLSFRVLDWWHPSYPHDQMIQQLLNKN